MIGLSAKKRFGLSVTIAMSRRGSSLAAIKGYLAEEWGVDIRSLAAKIRNYVINAVSDGELKQTKGRQ